MMNKGEKMMNKGEKNACILAEFRTIKGFILKLKLLDKIGTQTTFISTGRISSTRESDS